VSNAAVEIGCGRFAFPISNFVRLVPADSGSLALSSINEKTCFFGCILSWLEWGRGGSGMGSTKG
jgi:hypothetical protein